MYDAPEQLLRKDLRPVEFVARRHGLGLSRQRQHRAGGEDRKSHLPISPVVGELGVAE
jgi:hypothetical protein